MSALDRHCRPGPTTAVCERRTVVIEAPVTDADVLAMLRFVADNERRADHRRLLYAAAKRLADLLEGRP